MADDNTVTIRRATISNYLDENITVGYDEPKKISDDLGIDHKTVKNDLKWLKDKAKEEFKKYNLDGLRRSAKRKVDRLYKLQEKAQELQSSEIESQVNNAIYLEMEIMKNIHQLECDGIGVITDEIETREKQSKRK